MARFVVPFGTNPEEFEFTKGSIILYDIFDTNSEKIIKKAIKLAEERNFEKIIIYPLHEKTGKRMDINISNGYKQRIKMLEDIKFHLKTDVTIEICKLEGRRNKYTPIDTALNFIYEHQKGPYFLFLPDFIANKFATFSTFDKWMKDVRLMIYKEKNEHLHQNIVNKKKRWEWI